jgi:molecular chaperone GrpE
MNKKKSDSKSSKSSVKKKSPSVKELNESLKLEKEKYVRLFAEFENYKRRTSKERIELYKTAGKEVISALIPVIDDFKRAFEQESNSSDNQGISLIYNKLSETLKNQGLIEIEVNKGDLFDSEIHEAISQIPALEEDQKGKIIDIIEGGYKLGEQVLKYPKVVVAQ